jgi:hypothetical protein
VWEVTINKSPAQLDAILNHIAEFDLTKVPYLSAGTNILGGYYYELINEAKVRLFNWFRAFKEAVRFFRDTLFSIAPCNPPSGVVFGETVQHPGDN